MADIDNAHKYEVLIDGAEAPEDLAPTAFGADNGNVIIFRDEDGALKARAGGTGTTNLHVNYQGRSGAVTVNITNDPIDITFGEPEPL